MAREYSIRLTQYWPWSAVRTFRIVLIRNTTILRTRTAFCLPDGERLCQNIPPLPSYPDIILFFYMSQDITRQPNIRQPPTGMHQHHSHPHNLALVRPASFATAARSTPVAKRDFKMFSSQSWRTAAISTTEESLNPTRQKPPCHAPSENKISGLQIFVEG